MSDDIHERVALDVTRMAVPLIGEQWFDTEKFVHDELTEKIAEILRREYGELEVMLANRDLALRMHSDNIASLKAKFVKLREYLGALRRHCFRDEHQKELRDAFALGIIDDAVDIMEIDK